MGFYQILAYAELFALTVIIIVVFGKRIRRRTFKQNTEPESTFDVSTTENRKLDISTLVDSVPEDITVIGVERAVLEKTLLVREDVLSEGLLLHGLKLDINWGGKKVPFQGKLHNLEDSRFKGLTIAKTLKPEVKAFKK